MVKGILFAAGTVALGLVLVVFQEIPFLLVVGVPLYGLATLLIGAHNFFPINSLRRSLESRLPDRMRAQVREITDALSR